MFAEIPATDVPVLDGVPGLAAVLGDQPLFAVPEATEDQFLLEDGSRPPDGDPAAQIEQFTFTSFDLDRKGTRALRSTLAGLPDDAILTAGQPLGRLLKPGRWTLFAIDTAGDPTGSHAGPLVYQVAHQGGAGKSVAAHIPGTNPLDGARAVQHMRVDPGPRGNPLVSLQASDFGSRKRGPDGQTQYYNAVPKFLTITTHDGVIFMAPAGAGAADAFRPMAWDSESGAWDLVSTPDSPMGFIPIDGSAAWLFDLAALSLSHVEMPNQSFWVDNALQNAMTLPSGPAPLFISGLLADVDPVPPATIGYDLEDRSFLFEAVEALYLDDYPANIWYPFGIPSYGEYCLTALGWEGVTWSDGTPITAGDLAIFQDGTDELTRALGASCFVVDEQEGILHSAAWWTWMDGMGPPAFDPEAASRLLAEAGWVMGPDGIRRFPD
jgi:hypothetical protein